MVAWNFEMDNDVEYDASNAVINYLAGYRLFLKLIFIISFVELMTAFACLTSQACFIR